MFIGKEIWGPIAWNILHSFSLNNNYKIPENKKKNYYLFYTSFAYILPCMKCSEHYGEIIHNKYPMIENKINKIYLKKWVYSCHNIVNQLLKKPIFSYEIFSKKDNSIHSINALFFIDKIYTNFDYERMSLYKYDQIYNFFINFCLLYPENEIRKKLTKVIKSKSFQKIETPIQFKEWFTEYFINII
jgi:hypothetical protein